MIQLKKVGLTKGAVVQSERGGAMRPAAIVNWFAGIELDDYDEDADDRSSDDQSDDTDDDSTHGSSHNSPLVSFAHHWDSPRNRQISPAAWSEFKEVLALRSDELRTRTKSQLQKNIDALAKEVGFDAVETAILSLPPHTA